MNESILSEKTYAFAIRVVRMYQHLSQQDKGFPLFKQVLGSRTSIGANVEEALGGISKKDFVDKLSVAYKEARETKYWLRLLKDTAYISEEAFQSMFADCEELLKLLYVIIQKSKNNK